MQTFERFNIERWLENGGTICPLTGTPLQSQELQDNQSLALQIHAWLQEQGYTPEAWAEQMKLNRRSVAPFSVSATSTGPPGRSNSRGPIAVEHRVRRRPTIFHKVREQVHLGCAV